MVKWYSIIVHSVSAHLKDTFVVHMYESNPSKRPAEPSDHWPGILDPNRDATHVAPMPACTPFADQKM